MMHNVFPTGNDYEQRKHEESSHFSSVHSDSVHIFLNNCAPDLTHTHTHAHILMCARARVRPESSRGNFTSNLPFSERMFRQIVPENDIDLIGVRKSSCTKPPVSRRPRSDHSGHGGGPCQVWQDRRWMAPRSWGPGIQPGSEWVN